MSIKLKDTIYDLIDNADKLDGSHLTDIIRYYAPSSSSVLNLDDLKSTTGFQVTGWAYAGSPYVNSQPAGDGASSAATVIKFPGNYPFQIYRFYSSNDIKVRGYYSGTGWTSWATILTSDNYTTYCAPASHSHNYASTVKVGSTSYSCSSNVISLPAYPTIPTSLKCPKSLTIQLNGTSQGAWDGSADKTINITPASIGASASHSHPYLPTAGGTMTGAINFQIGTQTALINARYDGTNYTNILWHKHGDSSGVGSTVIFGSPLWENVVLETKANQNCAYRQTSGNKYKIWDSGNDGSGSGLDADTLDGVHLMGKGGTSGVMRSWARGTYTTSKQYFGNGNVVVIDPNPTDDSSLWANTTIFSVGDMEIRSHQLAFGYNEDKILYRRIDDGPRYNAWKTIAFTDSKVNNAGYADNSGQLNGYGEGNYYRQSRGALNNANLNTFVKRNSGGYSINYSGYSGLLVSLQGNGGSTSSIEFIATHYDIKTGGLKVRYTIDSTWYGDTKSIAFLDSNVASASKLATARTISLTGSVTGSGSFDGSGNLSISTTTNHTHSYYPLSGNTNMSGDNVWIGSTMGGGTDYWRIGGSGTGDNGICRITIGDNSNDKFQIQIADYSGTTYTPLEVTYNKLNIVGLVGITANGRTLTIGSQNADHCHYSTDAPCHWFNKLVRVAGDVYGGSSYNRRLAYVDEVALSGHTHSYLSTNIASSLTNTATVNYANTPYGVNYRNHYSGHGLGSYRGVLTCKDNSVGFELNSYWCVNPADGVGTNNLYYRVKRDSASDWGPYARIIDSGNIGSQSVNYANSAGNANTVDGYHISVGSSAGSDASTIYFIV